MRTTPLQAFVEFDAETRLEKGLGVPAIQLSAFKRPETDEKNTFVSSPGIKHASTAMCLLVCGPSPEFHANFLTNLATRLGSY